MIGKNIGVVVLAVALLATGCSGSDQHDAATPTLSERLEGIEPEPPVRPATASSHQDRDPEAVTSALWELDPCRLIAPRPGERGTIDRDSPHACSLRIGVAEVDVDLGQRLEPAERYQLDPTNVAGAKAYVVPGDSRAESCRAWLPVSFTQAIAIRNFYGCAHVRPVLERVVERIGDPSSHRPVPGLRDLDTCTLLRLGLGPDLEGRTVAYSSDDVLGGIDWCLAQPDRLSPELLWSGDNYASLEIESYEEQALTFEEGASDTPTPESYASVGWPADFGTVRGREIFGARKGFGGDCVMRWAESTTILQLYAASCEKGRELIARMSEVLEHPPPRQATPQQPLLYGAQRPDRADRGVCVDYEPLWFGREYTPDAALLPGPDCHPYVEPELPDGVAETVVAAEADPNVTCEISTDIVRTEFGERLRPATLDVDTPAAWSSNPRLRDDLPPPFLVRPCVFVDPERVLQVQVFVSSDPMALRPDLADQLVENDSAMRTVVGGGTYGVGKGYMIGLGERPDDPGYVAVFVGGRRQQSNTGSYRPMPGSADDVARAADTIVDEELAP